MRLFLPTRLLAGGLAATPLAMAMLALGTPARAETGCDGPGVHVTVLVDGFRSAKGDVVVEIYPDDSKRFLGRQQQVASVHQKLTGTTSSTCLTLPAPGYYAVAVFHDENADYKFNRNVLGIPTEGFGLSNNPPIHLGLPAFDQVRYRVDGDTTVRVRLRYFLGGGAK